MTTAPDREHARAIIPGLDRDPEDEPERTPRERLDRVAWAKAVMLLNVVLIGGVAIVGLTHARESRIPHADALNQPSGVTSTLADPDEASAGADSTTSTSEPTAEPVRAPEVKPTMRANFAAGDPWPYAAGFREAGEPTFPLGIVDGVMTHGAPRGPNAVSWLERSMGSDVQLIGARVLFAADHSGAAALTAWRTSILDLGGQQTPATGMRLVMTPGQWKLVTIDDGGATTLAQRSYRLKGRSGTFSMVRRGRTLWVTDPEGTVTRVRDRRVADLAGPWASWELRDSSAGKQPAGFQEIWAR